MSTIKLPQFLKKIDELTGSMEQKKLQAFIHEVARTLPEEKRNSFLEVLTECAGASKGDDKHSILDDDGQEQITKEIESVIAELDAINDGEKCLDSEYNEEWDDWYNSDVDEILFYDPKKLLITVSRAVGLVHICIDRDLNDEGCQLSGALCYVEVQAEGDYRDYSGSALDLNELYEHDLLPGRIEDCLLECLYLTYMGNNLEARAEELYFIFERFRYCDLRLENLLQMGDHDLPEFDSFLPLWIDHLGRQQGECAKRLISEAQSMVEDDFALLENARKYVDRHPELYLQLLDMKSGDAEDEKMLAIGQEAMDAIPVELVIRSAVALKTAEYADRLCRFDVRERCWIEAFRSDTSVVNYMRIKFLPWNAAQYGDEVRAIIDERYDTLKKSRTRNGYYDTLTEKCNEIDVNSYCAMMFFECDFDAMEKAGMSTKKPLGWTSTFMKEGIALILLMMYKKPLSDIQPGMRRMLGWARRNACYFSCEALYKGTDEKWDKTDDEKFIELFEKWKVTVDLPEALEDKWMQKIDKWIQKRTAGIMEANRRNYYGECAGFIAAFGEMKESLGDVGARNRLMLKYRKEYSRRSAFHRELKGFGMKDER